MFRYNKRGILGVIISFVFVISIFSGINAINASNVISNSNLISNSSLSSDSNHDTLNQIDPEINYKSIAEQTINNEKNTNLQMQKYHNFVSKFADDNNLDESHNDVIPKTNLYLKTNSYNDWYSDPVLNIDFDKLLYKPNEKVNFIVQATQNLEGYPNQPVDIYIYDTEDNFYYSIYGYFDNKNQENIGSIYYQRLYTDGNGFVSGSFTPTSSGRYVLTAKFPNSNYFDFYHVITVSELGIFLRMPYYYIPGQDISGYALIVNGTNGFSPISNAEVNLQLNTYNWDNYEYTPNFGIPLDLTTDDNGYVYFDLPTEQNDDYWGELVVTASKGTISSTVRRSIWSSWYYQSENSNEYVPTLDKPIYQPGEVIKGRVLVWKNSYLSATKTPLNNTPITVKLQNPSLITIRQRIIPTDENGIIDFEFLLDEDTEVGDYHLSFETSAYDKQFLEIPVKFYEKPAFKVLISTEKEFILPGSSLKGKIEADYYFGKPVSSGVVSISIFNPSSQNIVGAISGTTDLNGEFEFIINIPNSLADTDQIEIRSSVEDPVGRTVSNSKTLSTVADIFVWGWINPWLPKPDDSIEVTFYTYQTASDNRYGWYGWWNPIPLVDAQSKITIYGRTKGLFGFDAKTVVYEETTSTDKNGMGLIDFSLQLDKILRYDDFIVVVDIRTEDNRHTSTEFSFHYAIVYVDISPTKESYIPGETITLDISLKKLDETSISGNVSLVINDAEYDTIGRGALEIFDGKGTIQLPTSNLAPEGFYYGYGFIRYIDTSEGYNNWYYYYSDRFVIKVGSESPKLDVTQSPEIVNAGDNVTISGELMGSSNSPIFIEIVKRGITSVYVIPDSNEFSVEISNTEFLAPKMTIFIFTILNSGIILEHYITIEINQEFNAEITTDKDIYEPGESATVSIKLTGANNKPLEAMTALTFVDGSIYGVIEDPLWEEKFFSEEQNYWPSVTTVTNWNGFQPLWWYPWYWGAEDGISVRYYGNVFERAGDVGLFDVPTAEGGQQKSGPPTIPEAEIDIRDNLPESMYWIPRLFIPKTGWDQTITLPDNIGEWVVRLTITKGGSGVVEKATFNTQLPFFVEISKPALLMQDDIVGIKGVFYNYLDELVKANVTLDIDGVEVLGKNSQQVIIPSNFLTQVTWAVYAKQPGTFNVTITAVGVGIKSGNVYTDGLRKTIRITPNGVTRSEKQSGELNNGSLSLNFTRYPETIDIQSSLTISPGLQNLALTGWERLVGYPYGCVEQTMSRVLPTAMVYQYLQSINSLDEQTEKYLNDILTAGLSRLYSFKHSDGGFGWWHNDASNSYMTAYVVYGLNKVAETGIYVEESILLNAAKYLISKQSSGKWTSDYWNIEDLPFTAFVSRSLSTISNTTAIDNYNSTLISAHTYISNQWSSQESSYVAGLALEAFYSKFSTSLETELYLYLQNNFATDGGVHWTDTTGYRALGGDVETSANALRMLATIDYGENANIIQEAIQWIILQQRKWGWYTTADTSAAIQTFIALGDYVSDEISGTVELTVNGLTISVLEYIDQQDIKVDNYNLEKYLHDGVNNITLDRSGLGKVLYYLSNEQILREELSVDYPDKLQGKPGEKIQIPITLTNPSNENVPINVDVNLLDQSGKVINGQSRFFSVISTSKLIAFSYTLPLIEGKTVLKGISVQYSLADTNNILSQSNGLISSIFGPIELEITQNSVTNQFTNSSARQISKNTKQDLSQYKMNLEKETVIFERTYSKEISFNFGDSLTVNLRVKNTGSNSEFFLMVEDSLPVGFEVDKTSLNNLLAIANYKQGLTKTTFFIDELSPGEDIILSYRLTALKVYSSISAPAKLSSMYDTWELFTSMTTLGSVKITKNQLGDIVRDLSLPSLKMFSYKQNSDNRLTFNVEAEDNDGIALVQIFYENNNAWTTIDLIQDSENQWNGISHQLIDENVDLFIVLHDNNGNIYTTDLQTIFITLVVIPVIIVIMLLSVAVGGGIGANKLVKRKLYKE